MSAAPVAPVAAALAPDAAALPAPLSAAAPAGRPDAFARLLAGGVGQVDRKVLDAEAMVKAFALDDSVPLHQVTFALEQARLATELMTQVRSRLLEGYQELMRMQV